MDFTSSSRMPTNVDGCDLPALRRTCFGGQFGESRIEFSERCSSRVFI